MDPIDGTSLTAAGLPNALYVIAVSDRDTMLDASATFYMDKIVTDGAGHGVVNLDNSPGDNKALGGYMQVRLHPQDAESADCPSRIWEADDLFGEPTPCSSRRA